VRLAPRVALSTLRSVKPIPPGILGRFRLHLSLDADGALQRYAPIASTVVTDRIIGSLDASVRDGLPPLGELRDKQVSFSRWMCEQPASVLRACRLDPRRPPQDVHFVRGPDLNFYDLRNTDMMVEDLLAAGACIKGRLLDFGCSSGRDIATLHRAYADELQLCGVDPAGSSIEWARARLPDVPFQVSGQHPPLDFPDESFDLIIAHSIWTHFSERAAKAWFCEMARALRLGGHFLFSTHGPHDVAYRQVHDPSS
jgi:2-polyprenyl-3-methyl-5-hydroxy-6-metoxy-1,4-benzoquinol methylase